MPTNLAIIGRRGSGKTTIATELMRRGYTRHSWADPVKEIARWAYGHVDKAELYTVHDGISETQVTGRWILQRIGTEALRGQVDQDFWIKVGLRKIENDEIVRRSEADGAAIRERLWVNDDTRFPNEVEALKSRGFKIVYVSVPDDVRIERLGKEYDPVADTHPSETSISMHDANLIVNGTLTPKEIVDQILEATTAKPILTW